MKILFLYPQDICYGMIDAFAKNLSDALTKEGLVVEVFDIKTTAPEKIAGYIKNEYIAVLDFYSGLAGITISEGRYAWDLIDAPYYQLCLDFPLFIADRIDIPLKNHYILCGNDKYIPVIKEAMPHIRDAYFFPMTGVENLCLIPWKERSHDVVFIGTYNDYREYLGSLSGYDSDIRLLAETIFNVMKEDVGLDQIEAMKQALEILNISISGEEMYDWFKVIGGITRGAFSYHRERIIEKILDSGIKLEVFGDSWKNSPFFENKNLIINDSTDEIGYKEILSDTKVSLNVMYANKSGFTERYGYSMLNGAVCVSDTSDYICNNFEDKKDIVFYDLQSLDDIADKIKWLLDNPKEGERISKNAYNKAKSKHLWKHRAENLISIITEGMLAAQTEYLASNFPGFFENNTLREKRVTTSAKMRYLDILSIITEEEIRGGISPLFILRFDSYNNLRDFWNRVRFFVLRFQFVQEKECISEFINFIDKEQLSCVAVKYAILTSSFNGVGKILLEATADYFLEKGFEIESKYLLKTAAEECYE